MLLSRLKGYGLEQYTADNGLTKIQLKLRRGAVWVTQAEMIELFRMSKQNIGLHIKNIFAENELSSEATVKEYLTVQIEEVRKYNLHY